MHQHTHTFLVGALLAGGCSGGKGGGDYLFETDEDAGIAMMASSAPVSIYLGTALVLAFQTDAACPVITETETSYEAVGGCTDSGGVAWGGTFRMVQGTGSYAVVFEDWSVTDSDSSSYTVSGDLTVSGDTATEEMTGVASTGLTVALSGAPTLVYSAYSLSGDVSAIFFGGESGSVTMSAEVEADGAGFALSGGMTTEGLCFSEADSGSIVAVGANELTVTLDGATECDGCLPWSTDDGASGSYCEEEDGGDTGS